MAWYKALVILAWLSVPVGGSIMLRSTYRNYLAESELQRSDCLDRSDHLATYVAQTGQLANQVIFIDAVSDRHDWDRSWAAMKRQLQIDARPLRPDEPSHYPATDLDLLEAEGLLSDQMELIREAVWKRDAFVKSSSGMFELGQQIANTKLTAAYYKRIGAEGIYLRIQEDLARLEDSYSQRNRERNRLNRDMTDKLESADRQRRDILRILRHLDEKLDADERLTFKEKLIQHAQEFQLRQELSELFAASS